MATVPIKPIERVQFYENHIAPFTTSATAIGLSTLEVTDLQTKTEAARAAYDAMQAARQTSETATGAFHAAVGAMSTAGAAAIKKIRGKAEQVGGNSVYELAEIPAPATPSPIGPPGTPFGLKAVLNPDGSIELKWKCDNPAGCTGVIYHVYRQLEAAGEFTFIGGTGNKTFPDATVPAGTSTVVYKIQGVRSSSIGVAGEYIVRFGTSSSGATTATVTAATPKLAA
jgi:hypothetical protein